LGFPARPNLKNKTIQKLVTHRGPYHQVKTRTQEHRTLTSHKSSALGFTQSPGSLDWVRGQAEEEEMFIHLFNFVGAWSPGRVQSALHKQDRMREYIDRIQTVLQRTLWWPPGLPMEGPRFRWERDGSGHVFGISCLKDANRGGEDGGESRVGGGPRADLHTGR
jgi:hypothetical protein